MGADKAFIRVDGVPLWQRQLRILRGLQPAELFIAGPPHDEWLREPCTIIPDAQPDAGPLAGLVGALRRSSTSILLVLAVDLPAMTEIYLRSLLAVCSDDRGIIPQRASRFEPVVAVYPAVALPLGEKSLGSHSYSLQRFAELCVAQRLAGVKQIMPEEEHLFLNMNTPEDLLALAHD